MDEKLRSEYEMATYKWYTMSYPVLSTYFQGEYRVLLFILMNQDGEISPSDMVEPLAITRQRITTILAALRKKGYVDMRASETDRRRQVITLTQPGIDFIFQTREDFGSYLDHMLAKMGEDGIRQFIDLMNRVL